MHANDTSTSASGTPMDRRKAPLERKSLLPDHLPIDAAKTPAPQSNGPTESAAAHFAANAESSFSLGSIRCDDLLISGHALRITAKGTIQVDGIVNVDVVGNEVIIGER